MANPSIARRRRLQSIGDVTLPVLGAVCAIGAWWTATDIFGVPPILLPSPPAVLAAGIEFRDHLIRQALTTLGETLQGFGLACVVGIGLGLAIAGSWVVERMLYPLLAALNAVPKPAFAPLLAVWLGFGTQPKVIMAFFIAFFPIVLATATGLTSTPKEMSELARSLSASRWQTFIKIRFPAAMPQIFVGLKVALPLALIGAVICEFVNGSIGLGAIIAQSGATADTAVAFASITILGIMGAGTFYLLVALERLALPWVVATTSAR